MKRFVDEYDNLDSDEKISCMMEFILRGLFSCAAKTCSSMEDIKVHGSSSTRSLLDVLHHHLGFDAVEVGAICIEALKRGNYITVEVDALRGPIMHLTDYGFSESCDISKHVIDQQEMEKNVNSACSNIKKNEAKLVACRGS